MGKSQLKQLKERLKVNGFTGQTNVKKQQRKRMPASTRTDKNLLLQTIREEFNPFDLKLNRSKHGDILGRNVQGAVGKPGLSKQIGEENRRNTLKREMERRNKIGAVIDRRFGENDSTLSSEDKMLERFTRERQSRSAKSSLFNLEDDPDAYADDLLTHYGQTLALDDEATLGEDVRGLKRKESGDEDEDEEYNAPEKKRSKNEVMKEVIAKSKMYKHERQKAKEEDLEVIENLDADLNGLRSLLAQTSSTVAVKAVSVEDRDVEYDANVREMTFDKRAKPSDRTKTEEELAEEYAANLKQLEDRRQRRMRGDISDDEDELTRKRAPVADDLQDDFMSDGEVDDAAAFGFGKNLVPSDEEENDEEDEEGEGEGSEGNEVEDISEDDVPTSKSSGTSANLTKLPTRQTKVLALETESGKDTSIAFTYNCPATYEELRGIFDGKKLEDQVVIVDRIVTLHHPSLHPENKLKLAAFGSILVEHALAQVDEDEKIDNAAFNQLIQQIYSLANSYTEEISEGFRTQLKQVRGRLDAAVANTEQETDYPLPSDMMLFTLVGVLFSTSDHFHVIVTPAMLLMGQHLAQFKNTTLGDFATSALLARLFATYQKLSKRYVPEVVNHINLSLLSFIAGTSIPEGFPLPPIVSEIKFNGSSKGVKTRNVRITDILSDTPLTNLTTPAEIQLALSLLNSDLETLRILASLWKGTDAYKEIFTPALKLLEILLEEGTTVKARKLLLAPVMANIKESEAMLRQLIKNQTTNREPLALQSHKPIPIPSYAPKFEENYSVDKKSYDPNLQRQEISKLKAQVKKERKGAIRELRKDNAFISREKLAEKRKKDKEYHEMVARLERNINQEG
ncbi:nucleolar protein 14 [Lipomyces arxii]|uniref:nucleolar protein 14 n=1 Tax=Lipomyces arxii TaxID=56418 RepID=UPI0034CD8367